MVIRKRPTLDLNAPLVVQKPFFSKGRQLKSGDWFDWEAEGCDRYRVFALYSNRYLAHCTERNESASKGKVVAASIKYGYTVRAHGRAWVDVFDQEGMQLNKNPIRRADMKKSLKQLEQHFDEQRKAKAAAPAAVPEVPPIKENAV